MKLIIALLALAALALGAYFLTYNADAQATQGAFVVCGSNTPGGDCDFVATGTSDQVVINEAITLLPSVTGGLVSLRGNLKTDGPVIIDRPVTLAGTGKLSTTINAVDPTINVIEVKSDTAANIRDLRLYKATIGTSGAGILLEGASPSTWNQGTIIENVVIERQYDGIDMGNSSHGVLANFRIANFQHYGIILRNTVQPDIGEWDIDNGLIRGESALADIYQTSGGGARISNTKMILGANGYVLDPPSEVNSSILIMSNNSIEGKTVRSIHLTGDGIWSQVVIDGNQFKAGGAQGGGPVLIDNPNLSDVVITDNSVRILRDGVGIDLAAGNTALVGGNVIQGVNGVTTGIRLSGMGNVVIGTNAFHNVTVPIQ